MTDFRRWQYRVSRRLGRLITTTAAVLTLGRMPPFVSTSAIVVEGDKLLVVIDPIRQEPVLPGGHLKWREGPEAALVRRWMVKGRAETAAVDAAIDAQIARQREEAKSRPVAGAGSAAAAAAVDDDPEMMRPWWLDDPNLAHRYGKGEQV